MAAAIYWYLKRSNSYYSLALQDHKEGNLQAAFANLDLAILTNPRNADAYYLRGVFAYECDNIRKAIMDLSQAIEYKPSLEAFYHRGLCYLHNKANANANALTDFDLAIAFNRGYEPAYFSRGQIHYIEHRYSEAIEDLSESIRLLPDRAHAYEYRGHTYIYQGNLEAALADFSDFIRLQPESFAGYYNRAVAAYNLERFQEVLADFTQSIAIDPNHTPSYYGRSNTYFQLDFLQDAGIDFDRARELEPEYPLESDDQHAFYHAGLSHHYQGHSQVALGYWNQALRLCQQHHDNSMREIVEVAIQSLERT